MLDANRLYVGANYHPHDWPQERWPQDIRMMRDAGFTIVRLGHLCWDSMEPEEGRFEFGWLDAVMDLYADHGIGVLLDIPTRPAPVWLHKMHPDIDITNTDGNRMEASSRYMDDVGNPHFQKFALRLTETVAARYGGHPALLCFCLCNELGAGFKSYSREALQRFQRWLEDKYGTVERLNKAWNSQRWSRKLGSFTDVVLPENTVTMGAPERYLDMRRFYSDEIIAYLKAMQECVERHAPGVPTSTNHWAEHMGVGFDWQKAVDITDYPGVGYYAGTNPEYEDGFIGACMILDHRVAETGQPMLCLEFQTGTFGGYSCPPGVMRMYAYLTLLYRTQAICAWTWRSMLGGEEQYLFGLLDHDGTAGWKYREFSRIALEFRRLEEKGIAPYRRNAEVAIAYSFESKHVSAQSKNYYATDYTEQVLQAYRALFFRNINCNLIDLRETRETYRLVIIPGHCLMDERSAQTVRRMVEQGATVIMTAYSAKVDASNTVFDTYQPGGLSDVFGIRVAGFDRARAHVADVNEGGIDKKQLHVTRNRVKLELMGHELDDEIDYHEYLELLTADQAGSYQGDWQDGFAAASTHPYGAGKAIYLGVPAKEDVIGFCVDQLSTELQLKPGEELPRGIISRQLGEGVTVYINSTGNQTTIQLGRSSKSVLTDQNLPAQLTLQAYDVEIVDKCNESCRQTH